MNLELSVLKALAAEYSFSINVRTPPRVAFGVPMAFDTRWIVEPKTGST